MAAHVWKPSTLGHGETMCVNCSMTNREAWVLGDDCGNPQIQSFIKKMRAQDLTVEPSKLRCEEVEPIAVVLPFAMPKGKRK